MACSRDQSVGRIEHAQRLGHVAQCSAEPGILQSLVPFDPFPFLRHRQFGFGRQPCRARFR
jgi:hypothetical protein